LYFHKDKHAIISPLSYQLNDYHHNGFRFIAPKTVLAYISQKDILDVGGSWGNSLVVLKNYTNGHIVSYDILPSASHMALHWASEQCIIVNMGMSDRPGTIRVAGSDKSVNLTTIDLEVERLNLTVGMIKADIEGAEPLMIQGAMRTIMNQRPVLELSLYHSTEIIELPKTIAGLGFYEMRYYFACIRWSPFFEYTLFAYPRELSDVE
jgi:hypothetical protein